ncbi:hypothetical protein LCGC14_2293110 [marine sediment metagenome]|uniref:Uncharacterized protein n=1 Tax=marine sediment metagenome TaxID=412755 RepID=A0A0F9F348_9ZZZZ
MEWPLVIEVPLEVVSGNKFLRGSDFRRLGAYKSLREQWCWGITIKLGAPKLHRLQKWVRENRPKMRVQFTCGRRRRIEQDNLDAGLKPVRDCLVMPKKSHPSGLGLIVDDSEKWLVEAPPKQELVGKGMRGWTRIEISPVEEEK